MLARWIGSVSVVSALLASVFFFAGQDNPAPPPPAPTEQASVDSSLVHPCEETATSDPFGIQPSRLIDTGPVVAPTIQGAAPGTSVPANNPACEGPDFSQRCALWGNDEYDHGGGQDIGCGKTMAQCGCALTSAASLLMHYGITRGPDGQATTPKALNDWFKADAQTTSAGVVSRGFVYGGVNWVAVATYSKLAAARFGTPELAYAGNLGPDLAALQREVQNGRPVVVEQPRHFILATSALTDGVRINDPFYPERTRLDTPSYGNKFLSGRLYKPGPDVSAIMVAAPPNVRFTVRDSGGRRTGLSPEMRTVTDITQSSFNRETAWRDPTCTITSPRDPFGIQSAVLTQPGGGKYAVDVEGNPGSAFDVAIYAYDQAGGTTIKPFSGLIRADGRAVVNITYNPAPGSEQIIELEPEATPTPSPTPRPGAQPPPPPPTRTPVPATAEPPTETPTVAPSATVARTPTPTSTPAPGPATKMTLSISPASQYCLAESPPQPRITAELTDASGRPARPTVVTFEAFDQVFLSGAAFTPSSVNPASVTSANGVARTTLTVRSSQVTVRATVQATNLTADIKFNCILPPTPTPTVFIIF